MAKNSHTTGKLIHLTSQGITELKEECEGLLSKRPRVVERLANARSMGDLSENSDYTNAKEELEFLDGRIDELEHVLRNAIVIKKVIRKHVDLGAKVTVANNGERHIFHIVGEWEADPQEQKISHESPLGRALLGKKVGDNVEVEAPAGRVVYKILSIE